MELSRNEVMVLRYLVPKNDQFIIEREIKIEGLDERAISSAVSYLIQKGLIELDSIEETEYFLGSEGKTYLHGRLPEEAVFDLLRENGKINVELLSTSLKENEIRVALAQLARFGIKPKNGFIDLDGLNTESIEKEIMRRKEILKMIDSGLSPKQDVALDQLMKRKEVVIKRSRKVRKMRILQEGIEATKSNDERIETLDSKTLQSGDWKTKGFREYELNPKKLQEYSFPNLHPLSLMIERIRKIFLQMGFREMTGSYLENTLWNMDALFIPQNHPARDLQDTFYVKTDHPVELTERDRKFQKLFSTVHEKGIDGYMGWGTKWSREESEKPLLRTHTTVNTIRYLADHPDSPQAIFSVDKVFRHESMDWKHLAELHQIEGAVLSQDVSLGSLKWIIKEFYSRLGLKNIRFIPSYYPYTEPSMDIVAEIGGKEVELGGSGIFRPEVTKPLGIKDRVMAWGMGLERFAMLYYDLKDIREIYRNDLGWLTTYKIPLNFKK